METGSDPGDGAEGAVTAADPGGDDIESGEGPIDPRDHVTLQPVTMDAVAAQLRHMNLRFEQGGGEIVARWTDFDMRFYLLDEAALVVQSTLRSTYRRSAGNMLLERCNSWNRRDPNVTAMLALKPPAEEGAEATEIVVLLDATLRVFVGAAPIQVLDFCRAVVRGTVRFVETVDLGEPVAPPGSEPVADADPTPA